MQDDALLIGAEKIAKISRGGLSEDAQHSPLQILFDGEIGDGALNGKVVLCFFQAQHRRKNDDGGQRSWNETLHSGRMGKGTKASRDLNAQGVPPGCWF